MKLFRFSYEPARDGPWPAEPMPFGVGFQVLVAAMVAVAPLCLWNPSLGAGLALFAIGALIYIVGATRGHILAMFAGLILSALGPCVGMLAYR